MSSSNWSFSSSSQSNSQRVVTSSTTTRVVRSYNANGSEVVERTTTTGGLNLGTFPQLSAQTFQQLKFENNSPTSTSPTSPKSPSNLPVTNESSSPQEKCSPFEKEFLDEHNKYRALHGAPPLKLNRQLCNFAQEWAQQLAGRNTLQHRSNLKYGENLFMASGQNVTGKTAVKIWYDEIKNYRFGSGGFSGNTGHFTQVVWKASREVGVGFTQRGSSSWVVANYDPPGNYTGQYAENVLPSK